MQTNLKAGDRTATTFIRFLHALNADGFRPSLGGILLAFVLLGAWAAWLALARVTLYEVTETARLEAAEAGYSVDAPVAGRVASTSLAIGREVKEGEVLAELETKEQQLQLSEESARLASIAPQIAALEAEVASEQRAVGEARQAGRVALDEARARIDEAESSARFAEEEARRLKGLYAEGVIAELVAMRAAAEAASRRAATETLKHAHKRLEREQQTQETERRVRVEKLLREKTELDALRSTSAAVIGRLRNEVSRRVIRAPASGQLGEVTTSKAGAVLREGDKLGTVVPSGELKIIAEFPPSAIGRVTPGQTARMRLTSFPWTQYGSLPALVTKVAGEARGGTIRVELVVSPDSSSLIPMQHGLPGTVEVAVERVSPAVLLLRAVKFLTRPSGARARPGAE